MKFLSSITLLSFTLGALALSPTADARRRRKPRATTTNTSVAIKALQGSYKFGWTVKQVRAMVTKKIKKKYLKIIEKTVGALKKDNVRAQMNTTIRKMKKNTTKFVGRATPWDTSVVDDQFAHKNNESMVGYLDKGEQKFFFFHNGRLYKIFISLSRKQFAGFNFAKFQMAMEKAYGKAQEVFEKGVTGESELHHLRWVGSGGVELWAMDKTDVYGNFVFIIIDSARHKQVIASRKSRGVKVASAGEMEINPMVKVVTSMTAPAMRKPSMNK